MRSFSAISLLLLSVALGCDEPTPIEDGAGSREVGAGDAAEFCYRTKDLKQWPDYHFPLQHTFEVPEVPAGIVGPFSADDLPEEN